MRMLGGRCLFQKGRKALSIGSRSPSTAGTSLQRCAASTPRRDEETEMTTSKPPRHFNQLAKRFPEYMNALERLGECVKQAGPLDVKTAELIQLAGAAAPREEIEHALVLLTSTIGFPNVSAALTWADDVLE